MEQTGGDLPPTLYAAETTTTTTLADTTKQLTEKQRHTRRHKRKLECGPMPNVMVALPNIGGALCSTPQSLADAHTRCRAVTLPRRESRWNLQGCPKLANRSQPLVGRSSPYYEDMWSSYRCLTRFFSDCRYIPQLRKYSPTNLSDGAKMAIFASCIFSEPHAAHFRHAF